MNPLCPKCGERMVKNGRTPAPSSKPRWACFGGATRASGAAMCHTTTDPSATTPRDQAGRVKRSQKTPLFKRTLGGVTTLLVTAAQNATPAHVPFVKAMETLANERSGDILAIPLRYKNPTSRWTASQANEEVWADELVPYLCNQRKRLNKNLTVLGDVKTQPTAVNPLAGYEGLTHGESGILGHTKLALRTIPTPQTRMPKLLLTTGAATKANFTDSRAGKLGEFHYTLGAALVEIRGKKFHVRQINADKVEGCFYDLDREYLATGVCEAMPAAALAMGDTHVDFVDPAVTRATREIVEVTRPKTLVWNDLNDDYTVNPHHNGNVFNAIAKIRAGRNDAKAELERAYAFVVDNTPDDVLSVIVPSNHNDFLDRWVKTTNPHTQPGNFDFWCETAKHMAEQTKLTGSGTETPDPFTYWMRKFIGKQPNIRVLARDESFQVHGIEFGMHGDKGPNGARGSIKNLRRIGVKSVIGHSHSPGIDEGCYQVGTSTRLRLEYTSGPSGWLNTHCLTYANGKRTLLNIIDGEWRL